MVIGFQADDYDVEIDETNLLMDSRINNDDQSVGACRNL
jgi:hypothetical protein